jgi:hypothetical protein
MHVPVCVETDPARVKSAAQAQLGAYGRFQFYEAMFARAGFPDAASGFSQELVDALVIYGDETAVAAKLAALASADWCEVMAMPVTGAGDTAAYNRCLDAIASAATQLAAPPAKAPS